MTGAERIVVYDTTLRDGSQSEEVLFSVEDKVRVAHKLDQMGFDFIEGGWPGANVKDDVFFRKMRKVKLENAQLVAFGSTRRAGVKAERDLILAGLLEAETPAVTLFGKSWDFHVEKALAIPLNENLDLIFDSIEYMKRRVGRVFFDAEHFFDGFKSNPDYALQVLSTAAEAGAECLILCDTNGGALTWEVAAIVERVRRAVSAPLGIHCHNDSGLGVANTLTAVVAGAVHVQGTVNGIGERCGNADLVAILPNLVLKMGRETGVSRERLAQLTPLAGFVNEMANRPSLSNQPFVGRSAFTHKGGIHVSAVLKDPVMYEHLPPEAVGNRRRVLVSDQAGLSNLQYLFEAFGLEGVDPKDPKVRALLTKVKELEHQGYQFDGAEASFELIARRAFGQVPDYFTLRGFRVIDSRRVLPDGLQIQGSDATVKVEVGGKLEHTASEGNGPVNALDKALRKALDPFYPQLRDMNLVDFKVRILSKGGTDAVVRVLIESSDGRGRWGTVGVSENVIAASYEALVDAVNYKLFKEGAAPP